MSRTIVDQRAITRRTVLSVRPQTPNQLHEWLRLVVGVELPRAPLLPGHDAPFDYLCHSFFELPPENPRPPDSVVWASRGGGKTFAAALATLLDLIFKPTIDVRVLAGSLEQAQRMLEHLRRFFELPHLAWLLDAPFRRRGCRLINGSIAQVLAQSHTSVRGSRPQKLRCDEVELFDPDVWAAAQLVTRSKRCALDPRTIRPGPRAPWDGPPTFVRGCVEALSTLHQPSGLMSRLVEPDAAAARRIFRWSVIDTLERCPDDRPCPLCPLQPECDGRAKASPLRLSFGHFPIDDACTMKARTDEATWRAEMLCLPPRPRGAVFPEFDPSIHVSEHPALGRPRDHPAATSDSAPEPPPLDGTWLAGMDFGFRAPAVILWAHLDHTGVLRVVDERHAPGVRLIDHARALVGSPEHPPAWPVPAWIGVDPAGLARSEQTGHSAVAVLRREGLVVRTRRTPIELGLRALRARLAPASGAPSLFIHPRCRKLIDSLTRYRALTASPREPSPAPLKDGADHAVDALRYLVINLDAPPTISVRPYW